MNHNYTKDDRIIITDEFRNADDNGEYIDLILVGESGNVLEYPSSDFSDMVKVHLDSDSKDVNRHFYPNELKKPHQKITLAKNFFIDVPPELV